MAFNIYFLGSSFWSLPRFQNVDFDISLDRTNDSVAVKAFVRGTHITEPNPENSILFILHTRYVKYSLYK